MPVCKSPLLLKIFHSNFTKVWLLLLFLGQFFFQQQQQQQKSRGLKILFSKTHWRTTTSHFSTIFVVIVCLKPSNIDKPYIHRQQDNKDQYTKHQFESVQEQFLCWNSLSLTLLLSMWFFIDVQCVCVCVLCIFE